MAANTGQAAPAKFMVRHLVTLCLWGTYSGKSYRRMEGYHEGNRGFTHEICLGDKWLVNEAVQGATFRPDEAYLRRLDKRLLAELMANVG